MLSTLPESVRIFGRHHERRCRHWFSDNKVAIIAGLVAGIAGVILANVLTGGAIMAALPLLSKS